MVAGNKSNRAVLSLKNYEFQPLNNISGLQLLKIILQHDTDFVDSDRTDDFPDHLSNFESQCICKRSERLRQGT